MKNQKFVSVVLSVTLSFLGVAVIAYGATTIGTSITTTGDIATATASSTGQVKLDNLVVGQVSAGATISSAGAISASSTLNVIGLTTLVNATTTRVSVSDNLMINTASSTGLVKMQSFKVGATGSSLNMIVADYCTIDAVAGGITASTTKYMDCVPATSGRVAANQAVLVMATSSSPMNFIITQASTTAAGNVSLAIYNSGQDSITAIGPASFNFLIMSAVQL